MSSVFWERFKTISIKRKMLFFGAIAMSLGTFLPWYSDIDRFNVGDTFLGITGPLYLAGFVVLAMGGSSIYVIVKSLKGRNALKLPINEGNFHALSAVIAGVMIILSASVYFHPKFGINIATKQAGIGMWISIIGLLVFGSIAVMSRKEKVEFANVVSIDEPLFEDKLQMMADRAPGTVKSFTTKAETVEDAIKSHRENITNEITK